MNEFILTSGVLTGYTGSDSVVVIPSYVTRIANGAFKGNSNIKEVIIDGSISIIEIGAFDNCANLENITLPENIGDLEEGAFSNCDNIKIIKTKSIDSYKKFESLDGGALASKIDELEIADPITEIQKETFKGSSATKIKISSSVSKIGDRAFDGSAVKELEMPDKLKSIGKNVFGRCKDLKKVTTIYSKHELALPTDFFGDADIEKYTAIIAPPITYYPEDFENEIKSNDKLSSRITDDITHLVIGETVELIKDYAFDNYLKLVNVEILNPTTKLKPTAFKGCINLNDSSKILLNKHGATVI